MSKETNFQNCDSVFAPTSIAVIGASSRKGSVGYSILDNILKGGFTGVVYPVNPSSKSILSIKTYPTIKDVPDSVDLAVLIVKAQLVPAVIKDCAKKGVKGIVIVSAGFKEVGAEGLLLEQEVRRLVDKFKMTLVGPNCLGVINTDPNVSLNASFARTMPKQEPIAFVSQSGALCTAILDYAKGIDMGFSKFVSIGNKAQSNEVTILEYLGNDPLTNVILMYIEDFIDAKKLIDVSSKITREQTSTKPILAIKSGRTAAGAEAASSHTGSLAGTDESYDAIFAQSGILRVDTVSELFDLSVGFANQPLPKGNRIAIITNAGGPGIMATDASIRAGLRLAKLNPETILELKKHLPSTASLNNPIDIIGDALSDRYQAALHGVYNDPNVDAVLVILTPQSMTDIEEAARIVAKYGKKKKKPLLATFMGIVDVSKGVEILRANGIPHYPFPESAANVLGRMFEYHSWISRPKSNFVEYQVDFKKAQAIIKKSKKAKLNQIPAADVEEILSIYGFPMLKSAFAKNEITALKESKKLAYPLAMKIVSPDIIHKIDVGGVILNITSEEEILPAYKKMIKEVLKHQPMANITGIWLQEMAPKGGREVILGMHRDPQLGPLLMFGLGGTYVEIFKDVSFRRAPIRKASATRMIESIKTYPILAGTRGFKPVDLQLLEDCLLRLSQLVTDFPEIKEIDLNPLLVYEQGLGGKVVDVRMII